MYLADVTVLLPGDRGGHRPAPGLRLVLASGSPRQVFAWLERSRAQSFRVRPVRPPSDPDAAAVLAEPRQLRFLLSSAPRSGAASSRIRRTWPAARSCSASSARAAGTPAGPVRQMVRQTVRQT